jgi:hypothetical protein
MSVRAIQRRQAKLLSRLVKMAAHRRDVKVPLPEVAKDIEIEAQSFVPKAAVVDETAYDLNLLHDEGWIVIDYLDFKTSIYGTDVEGPALRITPAGLAACAENERSVILKAIDKQPMTAVQIAVGVFTALSSAIIGGISGWYSGKAAARSEQQPVPLVAPARLGKEQ